MITPRTHILKDKGTIDHVKQNEPLVTPETPLSSNPGGRKAGSSGGSAVLKYLTTPEIETPGRKRKFPRAKLLTSSESLRLLEEKEKKKEEEIGLRKKD